jgi:hypothetical protein
MITTRTKLRVRSMETRTKLRVRLMETRTTFGGAL